ncbi:kelch domain-containing protein 7A [Antennarius striatus]|uniref:kelch domain-containing protein 7A n=1 Tax=Antennarius striatus TaxID=241820 RepID=UPI0035AE9747
MTVSHLWGVQFDGELLWKLSLSVAALLLVSWAYRVFSSREDQNIHTSVRDNKEPQNVDFQNHKTTLQRQGDTGDGSKQSIHAAAEEQLTSDGTEQIPAGAQTQQEQTEDVISQSCTDQYISLKGETQSHPKDATSTLSLRSALNPTQATESGKASTTGRRSPCFLRKLEGTVGVGRELRQDLDHQGSYSSFLSKAEIKVKDANVVMHGTGDHVALGKIYDYYVESSSHSITESLILGPFDTESQPADCGTPSSLSPIIMRDLVSHQSTNEEPSSSGSLEPTRPTRPVLLRKESYLSAAEESELFIPSTSRESSPMTPSLDSNSNESTSVCRMMCSSSDSRHVQVKEGADPPIANSFLDILARSFDSTDVDVWKSKVDLSNCLEALYLAKKYGQTTMQQAALEVMSENYLNVLKDPNLYGQLLAGQREQIQKWRMRGRRFLMVADMDPQDWLRTTETDQRRTSSAVYYYDDYNDSWHSLCLIPQEVISKACAMCTMDNYLFVAVGCQVRDGEVIPSNRVFIYNPLTSIWKEICPMNEARPCCKLVALEGYVYAIGGECLFSVERYDPRKDRWTFVAPLPNDTFAVAHHVTACKGELYVCGGSLRYMLLRYNPKTNMWRPGLVAGGKDKTADMVSVWRSLYRFDINPLLGISVYRYHTVARLWYECCSKRLLHCPAFHCVPMDDVIYCVSRQFTMRFEADEVSPAFTDENLSVLSAAKGKLFPFVLSLPDQRPQQTSV